MLSTLKFHSLTFFSFFLFCQAASGFFLVSGDHNGFFQDDSKQWKGWGTNDEGALAQGNLILQFTPVALNAERLPLLSSRGNHTCAVLESGDLKCWGENKMGELGLEKDKDSFGTQADETIEKLLVVNLGTKAKIKQVSLGRGHSCVLFEDGSVKCWGANQFGQLGIGFATTIVGNKSGQMGMKLPFVDVGGKVSAVTAGTNFTCALLEEGAVKCWGRYLAIGSGAKTSLGTKPVEMGANLRSLDLGTTSRVKKIAAAESSACALFEDGSVKCWGANHFATLGLGLPATAVIGDEVGEMGETLPVVQIEPGLTASDVECGFAHCCATLSNGGLKCWGHNSLGQLGVGDARPRGFLPTDMGKHLPYVDLGNFYRVKALSLGLIHTCAVLDKGNEKNKVKCWGGNVLGQLGLGKKIHSLGNSPNTMGENIPDLVF